MLVPDDRTIPAPWNVSALLESLGTPFTVAEYGPQGIIFAQGGACDSVVRVERGLVRLAVTASHGKEATCGILRAGAFMGEEALGGHCVRRQTAIAMVATELLVVAKADMLRLLRTQPASWIDSSPTSSRATRGSKRT